MHTCICSKTNFIYFSFIIPVKTWVSLVWQGTVSPSVSNPAAWAGGNAAAGSDLLHADQSGHIPTTSSPETLIFTKQQSTLVLLYSVRCPAMAIGLPASLPCCPSAVRLGSLQWQRWRRRGHSWMNLAAFQGPSWIFFLPGFFRNLISHINPGIELR